MDHHYSQSTLDCASVMLDDSWIAPTMNDSARDCSAMVLDRYYMNGSTKLLDCSYKMLLGKGNAYCLWVQA